jgi:hypothetical protein
LISSSLWRWTWQRVPKRRENTIWRRGNTQKNIYNNKWHILFRDERNYACRKAIISKSILLNITENWYFLLTKVMFVCCCDVTMKLTSLKFVYSFRGIIWHDFLWCCKPSGVRQFVDKFVVLPDVGSIIDCWCHLTNQFLVIYALGYMYSSASVSTGNTFQDLPRIIPNAMCNVIFV